MHPFINVFGRAIPTFGILLVLAFALACLMLIAINKKKGLLDGNDVFLTYLIGLCGGIIGAYALRPIMRLVEVAISWDLFRDFTAEELLNFLIGEFVFYGGLLGGMAATIIFCRKFKIKIIHIFDIFAPALALAHSVGRLGCFFGGCCYGVEMPLSHPLSIIYPDTSLAAPPNVPLLAVPLIESLFLFLLSAVLTIVYLKSNRVGLCSSIYLLAYPIGRFVLEFFRGDMLRGNYGIFSTSQYISIGLLVFGIFYYIRANRIAALYNS